MKMQLLAFTVLLAVCISVNGREWYETGHTNFLTWKNFDESIKEQGKFKFVKFFTHSCKYCRMLKKVTEQLM
jgi:thioredoxin-related protein